ncbi:major facilitator superfamily domain-containing protein [Gaertneriomyces semiglobifer]|nr:major facilitator superfamily domain-containing protein [Gaertneriomyces semiglobifer]
MADSAYKPDWTLLLLSSLILFGPYYTYDLPGLLTESADAPLSLPRGVLYALYSLPNIITPAPLGRMLDAYNPERVAIALAALTVAGQGLCTLETRTGWKRMAVGRVLLGVGGEGLGVAQSHITTSHTPATHLSLFLSLNLSLARLGTVSTDLLTPTLPHSTANIVAFLTCVISLLCTMGIYTRASAQRGATSNERNIGMKELLQTMSKEFWFLCLAMCCLYATITGFATIHTPFLTERYFREKPTTAAQQTYLPDTLSTVLTPVFGYLLSCASASATARFRPMITPHQLLLATTILFTGSHALLTTTSSHALLYTSLFLLGVGYAGLVSLWTLIAHHADNSGCIGSVFGLTTTLMNATLSLTPLALAAMSSFSVSYTTIEFGFTLLGAAALIFAVLSLPKGKLKSSDPYLAVDREEVEVELDRMVDREEWKSIRLDTVASFAS